MCLRATVINYGPRRRRRDDDDDDDDVNGVWCARNSVTHFPDNLGSSSGVVSKKPPLFPVRRPIGSLRARPAVRQCGPRACTAPNGGVLITRTRVQDGPSGKRWHARVRRRTETFEISCRQQKHARGSAIDPRNSVEPRQRFIILSTIFKTYFTALIARGYTPVIKQYFAIFIRIFLFPFEFPVSREEPFRYGIN